MHDRANCSPCLCVATRFGEMCLDASALWHAGVQELPGYLPYMTRDAPCTSVKSN